VIKVLESHKALQRFRKEFGLSQKQVADVWGVTPQTYQIYEYGKSSPSAETIKKIAVAFEVSADYLLGISDKARPTPKDTEIEQFTAQIESSVAILQDALRQVKARGCVQDNEQAERETLHRADDTQN
jgi:transcriptional regulator with XRE-family HTH domain